MATTNKTVNCFTTSKGIKRTLQVEIYENQDVELEFTLSGKDSEGKEATVYSCISLNRREILSLIFFLISNLLPYKSLVNKKER